MISEHNKYSASLKRRSAFSMMVVGLAATFLSAQGCGGCDSSEKEPKNTRTSATETKKHAKTKSFFSPVSDHANQPLENGRSSRSDVVSIADSANPQEQSIPMFRELRDLRSQQIVLGWAVYYALLALFPGTAFPGGDIAIPPKIVEFARGLSYAEFSNEAEIRTAGASAVAEMSSSVILRSKTENVPIINALQDLFKPTSDLSDLSDICFALGTTQGFPDFRFEGNVYVKAVDVLASHFDIALPKLKAFFTAMAQGLFNGLDKSVAKRAMDEATQVRDETEKLQKAITKDEYSTISNLLVTTVILFESGKLYVIRGPSTEPDAKLFARRPAVGIRVYADLTSSTLKSIEMQRKREKV